MPNDQNSWYNQKVYAKQVEQLLTFLKYHTIYWLIWKEVHITKSLNKSTGQNIKKIWHFCSSVSRIKIRCEKYSRCILKKNWIFPYSIFRKIKVSLYDNWRTAVWFWWIILTFAYLLHCLINQINLDLEKITFCSG